MTALLAPCGTVLGLPRPRALQARRRSVGGDMDEISIFDADSSLGTLLDAVEAGRDVLVVRTGNPVARLVPPSMAESMTPTIDGFRVLRERIAARGETFSEAEIDDFRDGGRR